MTRLCGAPYTRPGETHPLYCQYIADHPSPNHSWFTVKVQDEADAGTARIDYTPVAIRSFLGAIAEGSLDIYLEAILAIAHERKRTLRGVRSFADLIADTR